MEYLTYGCSWLFHNGNERCSDLYEQTYCPKLNPIAESYWLVDSKGDDISQEALQIRAWAFEALANNEVNRIEGIRKLILENYHRKYGA